MTKLTQLTASVQPIAVLYDQSNLPMIKLLWKLAIEFPKKSIRSLIEKLRQGIKYFSVFGSFVLCGCMLVGPDYKEPPKNISKQWLDKSGVVKTKREASPDWWRVFHDPTLTALIHQGYRNNLSLQAAGVKVLRARAKLAQSVGELYPQQQALTGDLMHYRIGGSQFQSLLPNKFDTASFGPTASWELDFWGKYRRAILANDASFLASFAAYDNALVILTSDIASTYVGIRTTEKLIQVTKKNIQVQKEGWRIAKTRFREGQSSMLDVEQAQAELSQTQSSLPPLVSQLRQQKDVLAVLLGNTPDKIDELLTKNKGIPRAPKTVAVPIPKETIAQRPDIYQARMEAVAQGESIGAIKANLYPSFSLTGTFVFASNNIGPNSLSDIFNWANRSITAGPFFNWPILNYGQITNAVREQDAVFQEALLNYQNVVLKAQQEVQDNITQYIEMQKSEHHLVTANRSATQATRLALVRYKEGETDYTTVLYAERQQLQVQRSLAQAKGDISKALIGLYRALGGGWQIKGCNDIVPYRIKSQMAARTNWGNLLELKNHQPRRSKFQQVKARYLPNW